MIVYKTIKVRLKDNKKQLTIKRRVSFIGTKY